VFGYVVNGLAAGGGYALAGVGLSFTIGVARVLNFAFGSFYMLGAYLVAYLTGTAVGLPYVLACIVMLAGVLVLAYGFGRTAVLPIVGASESAVMIATLAVSLIITNVALLLFGSDVTFIRSPFESTVYHVGDARVSQQSIVALIAAPLVTVALVSFLRHTLLGARIRATAQNPTLAGATGISTGSVYLTAVVIGVMLAALAGALYGPTTVIDVFGGDAMLLKAFTVAALAGMGQLWGAAIVGVAMGIAESVFSGYVTPAYAEAFIFGLLVVTLLFFPQGVFRGR
jgi:branched-chain amino acid transport system permease protein